MTKQNIPAQSVRRARIMDRLYIRALKRAAKKGLTNNNPLAPGALNIEADLETPTRPVVVNNIKLPGKGKSQYMRDAIPPGVEYHVIDPNVKQEPIKWSSVPPDGTIILDDQD